MGTLRIFLAIAIVISHSIVIANSSVFGITSLDGYSSVRAFFIMSGFYMWMILNEKYIGQNNSYKLFITNRFLRIYPVYWTILILTLLFILTGAIFFKHTPNMMARYLSYGHVFNPLVTIAVVFSNLFIFGQDLIIFLGVDFKHGANFVFAGDHIFRDQYFMLVPQSWSLSIELFFYLLVPVLARRNIRLSIAIIALILAVKLCFYLSGYHYFDWQFFPVELAFFLLGGVGYVIYNRFKNYSFSKIFLKIVWIVLLLFTAFYQYIPTDNLKRWFYYVLFAAALPFIFQLTKKYKWDRYVGELSYPLFLSQYLVFAILKLVPLPDKYFAINSIICCIVLAIIIYHFVTIPIERIRQRRVKLKKSTDTAMPGSWKV